MDRLKSDHIKLKRTIKMALTCGEETEGAFNGAGYLATHERALIDAEFALNEGGGGLLGPSGQRVMMSVEAAEKTPQNYDLTVVNPGGHSSRPVKNNAIYHLAAGLMKISQYDFPVQFDDANRGMLTAVAKIYGGEKGAAINALLADPMAPRLTPTSQPIPA
jgi:acetylornithine deacetylase/succinyl-diaminopimelate desuccinylase-like protein